MIDKNSRKIDYLRISVTDMCNLRCIYCRPKEGLDLLDRNEILDFEEIYVIAKHAVTLGINNFRLTGGEPLARKGVEQLVSTLSAIDGVKDLAITTNGILLKKFAKKLKECGLSRINISLDTLQKEKFKKITRGGNVEDVFLGIEEAEKAGFKNLKINVVAMAGVNDDEIEDFAQLTLKKDIEVRFIELMGTRNKMRMQDAEFISVDEIINKIKELGNLVPLFVKNGNGPSKRFQIEGAKGKIGFINAMSNPFCENCNRLRLTSNGKLRSCLLKGGEVDVKSIIRSNNNAMDSVGNLPHHQFTKKTLSDEQAKLLTNAFYEAANMKPSFHQGADRVLMSQVGG